MNYHHYYYQLTNYPHVFKKSHWGNFMIMEFDINHNILEILRNRNQFVEDFHIQRLGKLPQLKQCKMNKMHNIYDRNNNRYYDHCEVYYTFRKTHIIIMSSYITEDVDDALYQKVVKWYQERGFRLYDPLYTLTATTFIQEL